MNEQQPESDAPDGFVERVIDLAVFAPVGIAVTLRDELPRHVRQRRQALENRIQLARFIGEFAVKTGQRELQKRIEQQREARRERAADVGTLANIGNGGASAALRSPAALADSDVAGVGHSLPAPQIDSQSVPTAAELPITDYESLPAINVVDRLRSMSPDEVELVRRFEQAHRSRRTILAKIDQLRERQTPE